MTKIVRAIWATSTLSEANYLLKLFHVLNQSFSLNEYDLLIVSSVFRIEMIDLLGKELKYAKELLLNHYGKSVQNSMRLQDLWVELKL